MTLHEELWKLKLENKRLKKQNEVLYGALKKQILLVHTTRSQLKRYYSKYNRLKARTAQSTH